MEGEIEYDEDLLNQQTYIAEYLTINQNYFDLAKSDHTLVLNDKSSSCIFFYTIIENDRN